MRDLYGTRTLTQVERRIVECVASGLTNRETAAEIGSTLNTVREKLKTIFDKTGVWNRVELTIWHLRNVRDTEF